MGDLAKDCTFQTNTKSSVGHLDGVKHRRRSKIAVFLPGKHHDVSGLLAAISNVRGMTLCTFFFWLNKAKDTSSEIRNYIGDLKKHLCNLFCIVS